jgi:DNA-binding transcriptional MerR regulator
MPDPTTDMKEEAMPNGLLVQDLARLSGSNVHTLRYYQRIGLIGEVGADGSRRHYSANDIPWIQFLMSLRATGMSVTRMLKIVELKRQGDRTAAVRRQLLENHANAVREKISALDQNLQDITARIEYCRRLENRLLAAQAIKPLTLLSQQN